MQPNAPERNPHEVSGRVNDVLDQLKVPADRGYESRYDGYELTAPEQAPAYTNPDLPITGPTDEAALAWEASEYIHYEKETGWFVIAGLVTAALAGLALIFKQWTFAALVIVMGVVLVMYARRPPRTMHYSVGTHGVAVEDKEYAYEEFRAFGIVRDGPLYSVLLIPRKRFMPAVTMYFSEVDGERIVDILGSHLPSEPMELQFIDKLVRKLRF